MDEYMPTPNTKAAMLVHLTSGMRIMLMSTRGWSDRASLATHKPNSTTDMPTSASTLGDPQPQVGPSDTPTSRASSHPVRQAAAGTFTLPLVRTGDSGMKAKIGRAHV